MCEWEAPYRYGFVSLKNCRTEDKSGKGGQKQGWLRRSGAKGLGMQVEDVHFGQSLPLGKVLHKLSQEKHLLRPHSHKSYS